MTSLTPMSSPSLRPSRSTLTSPVDRPRARQLFADSSKAMKMKVNLDFRELNWFKLLSFNKKLLSETMRSDCRFSLDGHKAAAGMCEADKAPRGEIKIVARCFGEAAERRNHVESWRECQILAIGVRCADTLTPKLERCSLAMPIFAEHRFYPALGWIALAIVDKVAFGQKWKRFRKHLPSAHSWTSTRKLHFRCDSYFVLIKNQFRFCWRRVFRSILN